MSVPPLGSGAAEARHAGSLTTLTPHRRLVGVGLWEASGHCSWGGEAQSEFGTQLELAWGSLALQGDQDHRFSSCWAPRRRWDAAEELRTEWGPEGLGIARGQRGKEGGHSGWSHLEGLWLDCRLQALWQLPLETQGSPLQENRLQLCRQRASLHS